MSDDSDGEMRVSIDSLIGAERLSVSEERLEESENARRGDEGMADDAGIAALLAACEQAAGDVADDASEAAAGENAAAGDVADDASEAAAGANAAGEDAGDALPVVSKKVAPRSRSRRDRPRSRTIALKRLTRAELQRGAELYPPVLDVERPQTREDCRDAPRPCPWVACKHHLYLDINPRTGSIKINFPDLEPWELSHTCALDVADSGGLTLEEIGLITNLTRERVRQVEVRGLLTLQARSNSLR